MLRLAGIISAVRVEAHGSVSRPMVGFGARLRVTNRTAVHGASAHPTTHKANAPPARSIGRDREAYRRRFFFRPLANEGVERREALGAGSARTLACPTGHAGTPDEASRAQ